MSIVNLTSMLENIDDPPWSMSVFVQLLRFLPSTSSMAEAMQGTDTWLNSYWSCLKPHARAGQSISVHGRHGFDVRIGMPRVHDPSHRLQPSFDVSMCLNVIECNHWDILRHIISVIWFNIRMHSVVADKRGVCVCFCLQFNPSAQHVAGATSFRNAMEIGTSLWHRGSSCDFCYIKVGQFWNLLQTRRCSKTRCWSVS